MQVGADVGITLAEHSYSYSFQDPRFFYHCDHPPVKV